MTAEQDFTNQFRELLDNMVDATDQGVGFNILQVTSTSATMSIDVFCRSLKAWLFLPAPANRGLKSWQALAGDWKTFCTEVIGQGPDTVDALVAVWATVHTDRAQTLQRDIQAAKSHPRPS